MKLHSHQHPCSFVVVSCFTPEYAEVYRSRLGLSLDRLETWGQPVPSLVFEAESRGSWVKNCLLKPEALLAARRLTDRPLLWVDADAEIRDLDLGFPLLRNYRAAKPDLDFAAYMPALAKSDDHDPRVNSSLMSGTLLFENTERSRRLLQDWLAAADAVRVRGSSGLDAYDQEVLWGVVKDHLANRGLVVQNWHPSWVKVHDFFPAISRPIVDHFQASREMKDRLA